MSASPTPPKPSQSLKAHAHNHTFKFSESEHTQPPLQYAEALFDFPANDADELPFEEQDIILIPPLEKGLTAQSGWLYGENNGVWGWFPDSYVRVLTPQEAVEIASSDLRNAGRFKAVQGSVKPYLVDSFDSLATNRSDRDLTARVSMESLAEEDEEEEEETQVTKVNEDVDDDDDEDVPLSQTQSQTKLAKAKYAALLAKETSNDTSSSLRNQDSPTPTLSSGSTFATQSDSTPSKRPTSWLLRRKSSFSSTTSSAATTTTPHTFSLLKKHSSNSVSANIPASPTTSPNISADTIASQESNDISTVLAILASSSSTLPDSTTTFSTTPKTPNTSSKQITYLQAPAPAKSLWADNVDEAVLSTLSSAERNRQEVMHEIISTEKAYVADLDVLMTVFLGKIRAGNVLRGKDLSVVFGNLEGILAVNKELLRRLEERKAQHPNGVIEQIGDIFVKVTDYLKMYTMYCSNHPYALMKLQTVRQTKSIAKFLDALTLLPECRNCDLSNFLLKPIQRICKYPLLIRELIKHTSTYHPDYINLSTSLTKLSTVVAIVNEGARQAENVAKTLNLQSRLTTKLHLIMPSRVLKKCGTAQVLERRGTGKRCEVYLFSDLMVVGKGAEGEKLKLLAMVPFDMILVNSGVKAKVGEHLIEIVHVNTGKFVLAFDSSSCKDAWVVALQEATREWLDSKAMRLVAPTLPPSPSKNGKSGIVISAPSSPVKIVDGQKVLLDAAVPVPIQFQLDGVPISSISQLVDLPQTSETLKKSNDSLASTRRRVTTPVPIASFDGSPTRKDSSPIGKVYAKGKIFAESSDSNDDMTLSQIMSAKKKLSPVQLPASAPIAAAPVAAPATDSDSEDEVSLANIVKKLPLSVETTIIRSSSREFGSKGSLQARLMGSTETLSQKAVVQPTIETATSESSSSFEQIATPAHHNMIVQEQSQIIQPSNNLASPSSASAPAIPTVENTSTSESSTNITQSLPAFKKPQKKSFASRFAGSSTPSIAGASVTSLPAEFHASSKESLTNNLKDASASQPASVSKLQLASSSVSSLADEAKATPSTSKDSFAIDKKSLGSKESLGVTSMKEMPVSSTSSIESLAPAVPSLAKKPTKMRGSTRGGISDSSSNLSSATVLESWASAPKLASAVSIQRGKSSDSIARESILASKRSLVPDLVVEEAKQSESFGQESVASNQSLVHNDEFEMPDPGVASDSSPYLDSPSEVITQKEKNSGENKQSIGAHQSLHVLETLPEILAQPLVIDTESTPKTPVIVYERESVSSMEPPALTSVATNLVPQLPKSSPLSYTRSHTEQPPLKQAPSTPKHLTSKSSNPIVNVASVSLETGHGRAFSEAAAGSPTATPQPQQHLSVKQRQEMLMKSALSGAEQGMSGGAARALSFKAEATGEVIPLQEAFIPKKSSAADGVGDKRKGCDSVYSSAGTMVAKADTEDEERQIEQLTMNKPVKRLVVQNVVQHTGRYYKDYIYIVRVYHSVGAYSIIHQTFDDFFDFHMSLIAQFPEDAGVQSAISGKQSVRIIPEFPPQMMFVSEAVAKLRMQQLQSYSMGIISLPARISRSPYVMKFFRLDGRSAASMLAPINEKEVNAGGENTPISVGIW